LKRIIFAHEKLDVYNVGLEIVSFVSVLISDLKGDNRNAKDQLRRASQSIVFNIAEGNGKRSLRIVEGFSKLPKVRRWNARPCWIFYL
jgi:hypothetical protein